MEYTLKEPIIIGTDTITKLTFRKPVMGDLRTLPTAPKLGDMLDLAAVLCGQPGPYLNKLGVDDGMAVMEIVGGFLPKSLGTGETPSAA